MPCAQNINKLVSNSVSRTLRLIVIKLVDRNACMTHAPLEQVIGLNLDHHGTCLFTKSNGGKGVLKFEKFVLDTLENAENLIALRLEDSKLLEEHSERF